jgi:hypothetical protein
VHDVFVKTLYSPASLEALALYNPFAADAGELSWPLLIDLARAFGLCPTPAASINKPFKIELQGMASVQLAARRMQSLPSDRMRSQRCCFGRYLIG